MQKYGAGSLTLAGTSATAGASVNNAGTLAITGSLTGSNAYSGLMQLDAGGMLKAGAVNALAPNSNLAINGGTLDASAYPQTIGALTVGSLGSLNLSTSNLLTGLGATSFASSSTLNLFGAIGTFPDTLMTYAGAPSGTFSNVSFNGGSLPAADKLAYNSGALEIVSAGPSAWALAQTGNWSVGANWSGPVPDGAGQGAVLNQATSAALTVTLDEPVTLGTLQFGNSGGDPTKGYTLSGSGTSGLTLNNSGSASLASMSQGTHAIAAAIEISGGNLVISASNSGLLGISGNISDDGHQRSLTLEGDGSGQLVLGGAADSYQGGTVVEAGTLLVNNSGALADGPSLTVGGGGTFVFDPTVSGAALASVSPAGLVAPLPEPGSVVLLLAALWSAVACHRFSRRPKGVG